MHEKKKVSLQRNSKQWPLQKYCKCSRKCWITERQKNCRLASINSRLCEMTRRASFSSLYPTARRHRQSIRDSTIRETGLEVCETMQGFWRTSWVTPTRCGGWWTLVKLHIVIKTLIKTHEERPWGRGWPIYWKFILLRCKIRAVGERIIG